MMRISTDKEIRENLYNPCNPCAIKGRGEEKVFLTLSCCFTLFALRFLLPEIVQYALYHYVPDIPELRVYSVIGE